MGGEEWKGGPDAPRGKVIWTDQEWERGRVAGGDPGGGRRQRLSERLSERLSGRLSERLSEQSHRKPG